MVYGAEDLNKILTKTVLFLVQLFKLCLTVIIMLVFIKNVVSYIELISFYCT